MKVLFDINVQLDVLVKREPFLEASLAAWVAAETGVVDACVCAGSFGTIFYYANRNFDQSKAMLAVEAVLHVFPVALVNQKVIDLAARSGFVDFEDAIQIFAAVEAGATHIITRDVAGFRKSPLPALSPKELASILASQ